MDLFAVDHVLSHLVVVADNESGGGAAEHFVSNLVRMFASMPGTISAHDYTTAADAGVNAVGVGETPQRQFGMDDGENSEGDEEDMIFGHEECNQFQEPTVFARVAAPYLCRALVALDARGGGSTALPEAVLLGLARLLGSLSDKLEELEGPGSATWHPAVYGGLVSFAAVGAAVLEFLSTSVQWKLGGGGDAAVELLSMESARARKACEGFEAARGGSEDVHPEVASVISHALIAARSSC